MILQLERPLVSVDVETHDIGQPETLRIVELGFHIDYPDGREKKYVTYVNPETPILKGASDTHHINDADVQDAPKFIRMADNLAKGFTGVDFCGYNVRFDLRVLQSEFARANVEWSTAGARMLDPLHIWRLMVPRTLSDAVREFLGREPSEAHRALTDAEDARDVLLAQLERFGDKLPHDIQKLHDLCFDSKNVDPDGKFIWANKRVMCNFGKHKGSHLSVIPRGYLEWMVEKGDFSGEVKKLIRDTLEGNEPVKL